MPVKRLAPTLAALLLCLGLATPAAGWTSRDAVAWTDVIASDKQSARLEVRCEGETRPQVRLLHHALDRLPIDTADARPGWHGVARLTGGWGLDLQRPEHHGAVTYWRPCPDTRGCLQARDADARRTIRQLRKNWTWHLRAKPGSSPAIDMKFDLAGSGRAIDAACAR